MDNARLSNEIKTLGLAALFKFNVSESFKLFAKIGAHHWDIRSVEDALYADSCPPDVSYAETQVLTGSGNDLFHGLGMIYVRDQLSLRGELAYFYIDEYKDEPEVEYLSFGVAYHF